MFILRATSFFEKDIKKLDQHIAKRVIEKLEFLAAHDEIPGQLVAHVPKELIGLRKYRIGDWRVLFWIDQRKKEMILYGIEHRGSIYRRFE